MQLPTTTPANDPLVGPDPPDLMTRPRQHHRWTALSFLHWRYPVDEVQTMLPAGLRVDSFDGDAWVGLIPFRLDITLPGVPYVPWVGRFVETNVRTYVRAADGTRGIWFLSLDAQRLGAAVLARAAWSLPYMWSRMSLTHAGNVITYECRRRAPGSNHPMSRVVLELGDEYRADEADDLDHFLTARWTLFSTRRSVPDANRSAPRALAAPARERSRDRRPSRARLRADGPDRCAARALLRRCRRAARRAPPGRGLTNVSP